MSKNTDLSSLINYVKGATSGRLTFPFYTATTSFTGTVAGYLGFDSSGNILTTTSPATQWTTSGANIYYNTGNVGINNASPAYKLDVVGDINITGAFRINGTSIGTGGGGGVSGSGTTNYLTKWSGATSLTNSVIYDDGTNVSVGSTSAMYKLTVQPFTNLNFGVGRASIFGTDDAIFLNAVNNTFGSIPMAINCQHLGFFIGFSEAMRITSSKVVMINTTSGISGGGQLQVNGDVNISGTFKVNGTAIGTGGGGTGNISGSGTNGYVSMFTAGTTIGSASILTEPFGSAAMATTIFLSNNSVNLGYISFIASGSETGTMTMNAVKSVTGGYASGQLLINSTRVKVSNKLNVGDLSTADLIVGDLYVDANGFVKRATSAT
jgi:hypothetical protein